MGVVRRAAPALILLLSLWQLIAWGFWGLLVLLLSRGFFGNGEVASTGRQVVLGLALLLLAVLNPVTAAALMRRPSIVTWSLVAGVLVADIVATVFFFSSSPRPWPAVAVPIVTAALLVVAYPRRVPA